MNWNILIVLLKKIYELEIIHAHRVMLTTLITKCLKALKPKKQTKKLVKLT